MTVPENSMHDHPSAQGFLVCLVLGLTSLGLPAGWAQDNPSSVVTVPDAALRAVIEDSLGLSAGASILADELAELTVLEAPDAGIVDLTGLEHATGLTRLDLGPGAMLDPWANTNAVSDLSPLSGLTALTYLDLAGNSVVDVAPLAGLTGLRWLNLEVNFISDFSSLRRGLKLRHVFVAYNPVMYEDPLPSEERMPRAWRRYRVWSAYWILGGSFRLNPKLSKSTQDAVIKYRNALRFGWGTDRVDPGAPCVNFYDSWPAWDLSKPAPSLSVEIFVDPGTQESVDVVVRWLEAHGITRTAIFGPSSSWPDDPYWVWTCLPVPLVEPLSELPGVALIYHSQFSVLLARSLRPRRGVLGRDQGPVPVGRTRLAQPSPPLDENDGSGYEDHARFLDCRPWADLDRPAARVGAG